ncbi:MAG: GH3 auxin-responsive promoter family protein [Planctomycetota bacterium]|nr:GH3 auxin-responsive promoter family protein [Planctomycetota bacterium]
MFNRSLTDRLMLLATKVHCRRLLKRFHAATQDATRVQERVLLAKIRRNADSAYGREHRFDQIRSYADFTKHVPLQTYEDFEPYIARLRRGEHDALFGSGQKVRMFALTSGTTGKPKYIPVTDQFLKEFRDGWNAFGMRALMDHEDTLLRPIVQITSRMDETHTEAGIPCGAIAGLMAASQGRLARKYYLTPLCVAHIDDSLARYYTIMRLSVPVENVGFMVTANPATPLRLAKTAAQYSEALIRDIHDGTLWGELQVPDEVRHQLAPRLMAEPARATVLQKLLEQHGELLPKHFWKLGFMCNWTGGTLGLFLNEFPHYFGDTPVRDIGLLASEGRMSITMQDGTPAGILDVTSNFYEFIPAQQIDKSDPDCLRSHEVEVGRDYFIVLTNSAGLYRYSIGDQIRVVGLEGQAPIIEFLNKGEHICSLTGEKLSEYQAVTAINQAAASAGIRIGNYVLSPQWDDPPYYRLHIETAAATPHSALDRFCQAADRDLCQLNVEYDSKQKSLRLGRLRINLLPEGFLEARDQALSTRYRRNNEQYKHKFLLTQPGEDRDFPIVGIAGRKPDTPAPAGSNGAGVPQAACPPVRHKQPASTGRSRRAGTSGTSLSGRKTRSSE